MNEWPKEISASDIWICEDKGNRFIKAGKPFAQTASLTRTSIRWNNYVNEERFSESDSEIMRKILNMDVGDMEEMKMHKAMPRMWHVADEKEIEIIRSLLMKYPNNFHPTDGTGEFPWGPD